MSKSSFEVQQPEESPGFLLWQTTMIWQRLIKKALEDFGIAHAQFVIMAVLLWFEEHNVSPTQVLIADWSKLDKMTVSKSLKKLGKEGYTKRAEHETDTRAKKVFLTTEGRTLARQLVPLVEKIDAGFFDVLSARDQQELIRLMRQLNSPPGLPPSY